MLELTNNENFNTNARHLKTMSFEHAAYQTNLLEYVIQTSVADSSLRHGGTSLVESESAELRISANDGEYCGPLHLDALANLLNRATVSIYRSVGVDRGLLKQVLLAFRGVNPTTEPVHIIWTNLTAKQVSCIWQSNQFVACVPRFPQTQPPCTLPASQRSNHSHHMQHQISDRPSIPQEEPTTTKHPDIQNSDPVTMMMVMMTMMMSPVKSKEK